MSVLIVEDNPFRVRSFRAGLVGLSITNLDTAPAAKLWLADHAPRVMFLDYDLDEFFRDIHESQTGMEVVDYLVEHYLQFKDTEIIVHSLNRKKSDEMMKKLLRIKLRAEAAPFIWQNSSRLEDIVKRYR